MSDFRLVIFLTGVRGFVASGAALYDHRSTNDANAETAWFNEGDSLDPSFGHSDGNEQYHYHKVSHMMVCFTQSM
jgi:hypothetical protein